MESVSRIELFVPERAVVRHEAAFQQWVETVTAPLRYVCVEESNGTTFCPILLGKYIQDFEAPNDPARPTSKVARRKSMSAFSGFSILRDQRGVWFRDATGAPEEDRVSIYTFLVAEVLGELAYYALRERLAKRILRERNEQAVLLVRTTSAKKCEMEFVNSKDSDYEDFARAFSQVAIKKKQIELTWKQLHLFQLLQRDLMATVRATRNPDKKKAVYEPLFHSLQKIMNDVFEDKILERMNLSVFATWVKIAKELADVDTTKLRLHIETILKASILEIADSLWRFQGHSLEAAGDLNRGSCGVEAFAFIAALNTWQKFLKLDLDKFAKPHETKLQRIWNDPAYLPHLLLRDWRGLAAGLTARARKPNAEEKELATAFALLTVEAIEKSGISDERTWYRGLEGTFPT